MIIWRIQYGNFLGCQTYATQEQAQAAADFRRKISGQNWVVVQHIAKPT